MADGDGSFSERLKNAVALISDNYDKGMKMLDDAAYPARAYVANGIDSIERKWDKFETEAANAIKLVEPAIHLDITVGKQADKIR